MGRDEAESYGQIRAKLEKTGFNLGNMDMLIAAHAVVIGAILVTNDIAFDKVVDLRARVNWATNV